MAKRGRFIGFTADGYRVHDRNIGPSHNKVGDLDLLAEALAQCRINDNNRVVHEHDFEMVIGKEYAVTVPKGSEIVLVRRRGRHTTLRCAPDGIPQPTTFVTVVLQPVRGYKQAILLSAWYGRRGQKGERTTPDADFCYLPIARYVNGEIIGRSVA